jgi:hypothetical protein
MRIENKNIKFYITKEEKEVLTNFYHYIMNDECFYPMSSDDCLDFLACIAKNDTEYINENSVDTIEIIVED